MRVLLVGLPYFTEKLARDLREFDTENTYYRLDTYYNKKDRIKAMWLIPTIDVVYSINGALDKSRVFDWAFFWRKKVMMNWVGTDVTKARKLEQVNQQYLMKASHYCEVEWIQEELKLLDIDAKILNFFNFPKTFDVRIPDEENLKVLTYISDGREDYYGWQEVLKAARACPDVDFTVVGTTGKKEQPENMKCLGWVENMPELFNANHVCIRYVEHDGLSGFVLEALLRGKHVLYSQPLDHCKFVTDVEALISGIKHLSESCQSGELKSNTEGANYVRKNFGREKILSELIEEMKK